MECMYIHTYTYMYVYVYVNKDFLHVEIYVRWIFFNVLFFCITLYIKLRCFFFIIFYIKLNFVGLFKVLLL